MTVQCTSSNLAAPMDVVVSPHTLKRRLSLHIDVPKPAVSPPLNLSVDVENNDVLGQIFFSHIFNPAVSRALSAYFYKHAYELGEVLGKGQSSTVFQINTRERQFAFKLIRNPSDLSSQYRPDRGDPLGLHLKHENILSPSTLLFFRGGEIVEQGQEKDCVVGMIMPLFNGENLEKRLQEKDSMDFTETIAIGTQIASALEYAHAQNVLHRDLKPGNILINKEGQIRLIDFGLAKRIEFPTSSPVNQNCYAAPERIELSQRYGFPSDAWSLGILLYRMLCGSVPFRSQYEIASFPCPAFPLQRKIPVSLIKIIEMLLQPNPNQRMTANQAFRSLLILKNRSNL